VILAEGGLTTNWSHVRRSVPMALLLATLGVAVSATGVGGLYGARRDNGLLDGWLVDSSDAGADVPGVTVRAVPLWMTDEATTAKMVEEAISLAGPRRPGDG
jgi:LPPG:FO 2-phospho-L-lactate transferase